MILECEYRETESGSSKMPYWYYEKKALRNTPSMKDGLDYETECRYRKEGAQFIIDAGTKMDLGYNTMATGVLYFHRFYMFHSFKSFPRYVTACCCLFLAGKVEETPKKCRDIINTAKTLLTAQKFTTFGKDPKEEVMTLERILLQTIKFDLQVEHPYSYLLTYAKCLKGDKNKLQKMVQMAWNFVNDSLCTTLSLQWEPEIIAVALMYFAGKLNKFDVVDWNGRQEKHLRWWDMFVEDVTMDLLEDICHQMLDHYSQASNARLPASPPPVSSEETSRERIVVPPTIETPSNPPPPPPNGTSSFSTLPIKRPRKATTPSKIPKMETPPLPVNGGAPPAPIEVIQPVEIPPTHFPPYPPNFIPAGMGYPPVFPPTNISVPPPTVNTMNHIVSAMRHLGAAGSIRSNPPPPTSLHPFQPYGYQPNTTYFPLPNAPPPATVQRPYYPPQL